MQRVVVDDDSPATVIPLTDAGLDVAVVKMVVVHDDLDEGLWWLLVAQDVLRNPKIYELPHLPPVPADEMMILRWCRAHIQPPAWRWFNWEPTAATADLEPPDYELVSSVIPRAGWWQGAIVRLKGYSL